MSDDADQPPPPPSDTDRWMESEDRFWKRARLRREVFKNALFLTAGLGLAALLNQLGCLRPT